MEIITYPIGPVASGRCNWCGELAGFFKNGRPKKWCSDGCATRASAFRLTGKVYKPAVVSRECAGCGAPINQGPRTRNPRKWCSEQCRKRTYAKSNPGYLEHQARLAREREELAKPPRPTCSNCGAEMARRGTSKYCSKPECKAAKRRYDKERAPECSKPECSRPAQGRGLCSSHYASVWRAENPDKHAGNNHRYRARKRDAFVEDVDRAAVLERDGWRCGICGERILKGAVYPDPGSASIDHVVPLNRGGLHEMKNVQAAHLRCNALKSDRGAGDQLALL